MKKPGPDAKESMDEAAEGCSLVYIVPLQETWEPCDSEIDADYIDTRGRPWKDTTEQSRAARARIQEEEARKRYAFVSRTPMTVRELIEKLQAMPQNVVVEVRDTIGDRDDAFSVQLIDGTVRIEA